MDQRYVQLEIEPSEGGELNVVAPPNANHAPPGWYMLFILYEHQQSGKLIPCEVAAYVELKP